MNNGTDTDSSYVLDTSAFFGNIPPVFMERGLVTPGVVRELKKKGIDVLRLSLEEIQIREPGVESLKKVDLAARKTGDHRRLSNTDRELLALALESIAVIVSDDFSIQNLAEYMGIPWKGADLKGITHRVKWRLKCRGCRAVFDMGDPETAGDTECPVCGSELKTTRMGSVESPVSEKDQGEQY